MLENKIDKKVFIDYEFAFSVFDNVQSSFIRNYDLLIYHQLITTNIEKVISDWNSPILDNL